MTKINYLKFLKNNPEDVLHKDKNDYYVIRRFEVIKSKPITGLFGMSKPTSEKKTKVYTIIRKTGDKVFEELFKDTSYEKTKKMYNKLRTLNGDKFIVKFDDDKYIYKDLATGYKFGEYTKASEVKKVIALNYDKIYKFKNYTDILNKMAAHDKKIKDIGKNIKTIKPKTNGFTTIKCVNLKLKQ